MNVSRSKIVEKTLEKSGVHDEWEKHFRTKENEEFYNLAFDDITKIIDAPLGSCILDIGCGIGANSVRLAKRGFTVTGIDFSENILERARLNIQTKGLNQKIKVLRGNILSLPFEDKSFNYILSWGVLMHIPEVSKALSEICRVLKKGGILVVSETNMSSFQSFTLRGLKKLLNKEQADVKKLDCGIEYWEKKDSGTLMTRQANIRWLKMTLEDSGFTIIKHLPGQFTELHSRFSSKIILRFIHLFNYFWFKYLKIPYLAVGTVLIAKKSE